MKAGDLVKWTDVTFHGDFEDTTDYTRRTEREGVVVFVPAGEGEDVEVYTTTEPRELCHVCPYDLESLPGK